MSSDYWRKREAAALESYITDEKEYARQVDKIYTEMRANIQKEINAFYVNYADKEGITLYEAKKRVSALDIKAYESKAKRYVKDREFSNQANDEMRLYNATMRINRLEMLKANIGLELISGHDDLEKFMECILQGRTEDELKRQAGILGKTVKDNAQLVHSIVNASFHNATFSDRIWMYQGLLKNDLAGLITSGLIQGKNPRELARSLRNRFDVRKSDAERLMRTELARVQTDAQKQSFIRNGFTQYQFIVNGSCCDVCAGLSDKVFDVEDMMPGENAPPMHPNCRCSTAAYEDSKEYDAWLDYLDKGGTTEEWNATGKARWEKSLEKENYSGIMNMHRVKKNTGKFATLPEKMSKKHIREVAKECGIDLEGISINIDSNDELLRIPYTGRADYENVGGITFFPNAFKSKEELVRTIFHEKMHVEQFKKHGVDYVQNNREYFEKITYEAEDLFIESLKKEGVL